MLHVPDDMTVDSPRPLTGGAVMLAASRIGVTAAGAITTIVIARTLGPRGWAAYFVAQSLAGILLAGSTLGVEHGIAYFVSSKRWAARAAFDSALKVAASVGIVAAAIGLCLRLLAPSAFAGLSVWLVAAVVAGVPFALAWLYASYVALATDRYEAAMAIPAAQAALVLVLAVLGAVLLGVNGAVAGVTIATVLVGAGSVFWGRRTLPRVEAAESSQLRRAISFGIKGYCANALQLVNYRLDVFILSTVASTAAVGRYGLAVAVTSLLWLLPGAVSDVLFPRIARLSRGSDETTREMVESKSLRHVSLIVAVSTVSLAVALEFLVVPVFGESFRPAVALGLILLPGAAAIGVSSVLAATVVGRGKPTYTLLGSLVTTPLTIGMYVVFIPWLHATGAALASTLSYCASFVLLCWFYRRVTGRRVLPLLLPTGSELGDLRALAHAVFDRVGQLRRRTT
jgi:O-antigen/teichoic acid export membrane protein